MAFCLEVIGGPNIGGRYFIEKGQTLVLGRSPAANLAFPDDLFLSAQHCSIEGRERDCAVRDLHSTNGTFVNGQRITEALLAAGDTLKAGSIELTPSLDRALLTYFRSLPGPCYCLLDAACDPAIRELIAAASGERAQSLYDGKSAEDLAPWAPYLVELAKDTTLLPILLERGWGNGWASYFLSRATFEELRHHFRKFLLVKLDDGREAYFRFYDPRVLRDFLPTSNAAELREFFGPVDSWIIESKDPHTLLRLTEDHGRLATVETKVEK
jgi:hypothetical protein